MEEIKKLQFDEGLSVVDKCRTVLKFIEKSWESRTGNSVNVLLSTNDLPILHYESFTIPLEFDNGAPCAPDSNPPITAYIHGYGYGERTYVRIEYRRNFEFAPDKIITCCAPLRRDSQKISLKDGRCKGWLKHIEFFEDNRDILSFLQYYPDEVRDYRKYNKLDISKLYGLRKIVGLDYSPSQEDLEKFKKLLKHYETFLRLSPRRPYIGSGPVSLNTDESSFGESRAVVVSVAGIPVVMKLDKEPIDLSSEAVQYAAGFISRIGLFNELNALITKKGIEEY